MYPRYLRVEYKFLLVLRPDASLGFADALALFIVFLQPQKAQRSSSSRVRSLEPEKAMKIKETRNRTPTPIHPRPAHHAGDTPHNQHRTTSNRQTKLNVAQTNTHKKKKKKQKKHVNRGGAHSTAWPQARRASWLVRSLSCASNTVIITRFAIEDPSAAVVARGCGRL